MRVHELAKELGVSSKEILTSLEELGVGGRTASSSVPEEALPRLRATGGKAKPGVKVKRAAVEPAPKPRKKEAAPEEAPEAAATPADAQASEPAPQERSSEPATAPKPAAAAASAKEAGPAPAEGAPAAGAEGNGKVTAVPAAEPAAPAPSFPSIRLTRGATPQDVAEATGRSVAEVVKALLGLGEMASASQSLSDEALVAVAHELGRDAEIVGLDEAEEPEEEEEEVDESKLQPRPPVVTVMGHVDHGKTALLDAIRKTDVVSGEYGGITQHIGAYQVHHNGNTVTFLDTPGHEAFTAMRARGAGVTDIAVIVVAADDGPKPQTDEAIDHARAADVPIVVAVNKVDKEGADPTRVRTEMTQRDLQPAEWGGETEYVDVSAKTKQGLDDLLDTIQVVAELEELKANPKTEASGVVVESKLDPGRGPVVTILVQRGTLHVGDALVAGAHWGRVRAMSDFLGEKVKRAEPGEPIEVLGFDGVPEAGEFVRVVENDRRARQLAGERANRLKTEAIARRSGTKVSLEDVFKQAREGELKELNLVLKADVSGSLEAVEDEIARLPQEEVAVNVIHRGVGGINESDVMLAAASNGVVLGFNVRPVGNARDAAEREGVEIGS